MLLYFRGWLKGFKFDVNREMADGITLRFFATLGMLFVLSMLVLNVAIVP